MRDNQSIDLVKFIGRQHSHLTNIMDQMNSCYSFQVFLSNILIPYIQYSLVKNLFETLQMIINAASSFLFSLTTLYTLYRYTVQPNEMLGQLSFIHSVYQLMFLMSTIAIIYSSELVTSEVNFIRNNSVLNMNRSSIILFPFSQLLG